MKTTIEIADAVLAEAKKLASAERTTLRELVEQGLRHVIAQRSRKQSFRLRDASVDGTGLQPEFADQDWARIRQAAYAGRGG
ncbi:MAG TPA: type II toxin-antitoxin system VapB family antitoxin [Actinomycetota bacterium]|nr:type II toxin-antitoxin system VapB family antitoxin [Actinomycetota bacterium]